jgi:glycosyltransferase involved in cell wall biosynthesis
MNVLLAHNFYQQAGGEDQIFADEGSLLEQHGHKVSRFTMDNDAIGAMSKWTVARKTLWNKDAAAKLRRAIREIDATVVHFHNTFPLISPACYYAAHAEGAAVVQNLQNFRLLCVAATFCRDHRVCEDCLGKGFAWPGILHACYRESRAASAVVAFLQTVHRMKGTWKNEVDAYVAASEFSRKKLIEGGLPRQKMFVKPNFLSSAPPVGRGEGEYALFVGRLAPEKGIVPLLQAWPQVFAKTSIRLKIAGDGPMRAEVERAAAGKDSGIGYAGRIDLQKENYATMGSAQALIFPSIWYEGQPKTLIESLAVGTPVIASRLGAMAEMIADGETGFLFEPGMPADLAAKAIQILSSKTDQARMRASARLVFERSFTAEKNYPQLLAIYEEALKQSSKR